MCKKKILTRISIKFTAGATQHVVIDVGHTTIIICNGLASAKAGISTRRLRVGVTQQWAHSECCRFRLLPATYNITHHTNVSADNFLVSTVGLPGSGGGQVSVSKTASTIVRNSNAASSGADYANGSGSPLKTVSVDDDLSSVHVSTADPSSNMTGETLHEMLYLHIPTVTCIYCIPTGYRGQVYCVPLSVKCDCYHTAYGKLLPIETPAFRVFH